MNFPVEAKLDEMVSSLDEIMAEFEVAEQEEEGTINLLARIESTVSESFDIAPGEELEEKAKLECKKHITHDDDIMEDFGSVGVNVESLLQHPGKEQDSTKLCKIREELLTADLESTRRELAMLKKENDMLGEMAVTFSDSFREENLQLQRRLELAERTNCALEKERARLCLAYQGLLDQNEKHRRAWLSLKESLLSNLGRDEGRLRPQIETFDEVLVKSDCSERESSTYSSLYNHTYGDEEKREEPHSPSSTDKDHVLPTTGAALMRYIWKISDGAETASSTLFPFLHPPPFIYSGDSSDSETVLKEFSEQERPEGMLFQDTMIEQELRSKIHNGGPWHNIDRKDTNAISESSMPPSPLKEFSERDIPCGMILQSVLLERAIEPNRRSWRLHCLQPSSVRDHE